MGKTTPTITDYVHMEKSELGRYLRARRKGDQLIFDELLTHVSEYIMALSHIPQISMWDCAVSNIT